MTTTYEMTFQEISQLISGPLTAVDHRIQLQLASGVELVNTISQHIIGSGGKRLRPKVALLAGLACEYEDTFLGTYKTFRPPKAQTEHCALVDIASVVELLHTATLLHDDVVDESGLRRGKKTAHTVWGNAQTVLVGDYLIAKAFKMIVNIRHQNVLEIMAQATCDIAEGEVLQLCNLGDPTTTESRYRKVIHFKTARMFEAAAEAGATLANRSHVHCDALKRYARHLGLAFQLTDDLLDYQGDTATMGKNAGTDLHEGKPTLPLIHALQHGNDEEKHIIRHSIEYGEKTQLELIAMAVKRTGGLEYTLRCAKKEAELARNALAPLRETVYKEALIALTFLSVERTA